MTGGWVFLGSHWLEDSLLPSVEAPGPSERHRSPSRPQVRVEPCALLCCADSCPNTVMLPLSASSFRHPNSPVWKILSFLPVLDVEAEAPRGCVACPGPHS